MVQNYIKKKYMLVVSMSTKKRKCKLPIYPTIDDFNWMNLWRIYLVYELYLPYRCIKVPTHYNTFLLSVERYRMARQQISR